MRDESLGASPVPPVAPLAAVGSKHWIAVDQIPAARVCAPVAIITLHWCPPRPRVLHLCDPGLRGRLLGDRQGGGGRLLRSPPPRGLLLSPRRRCQLLLWWSRRRHQASLCRWRCRNGSVKQPLRRHQWRRLPLRKLLSGRRSRHWLLVGGRRRSSGRADCCRWLRRRWSRRSWRRAASTCGVAVLAADNCRVVRHLALCRQSGPHLASKLVNPVVDVLDVVPYGGQLAHDMFEVQRHVAKVEDVHPTGCGLSDGS